MTRFRDFLRFDRPVGSPHSTGRQVTALIGTTHAPSEQVDFEGFYDLVERQAVGRRPVADINLDGIEQLSADELKQLRRKLAMALHPDRSSPFQRAENTNRLALINARIDALLAKKQSA
ncbi:MAG: hypothetical protein OXR62_02335 [Ahrensia sp.]|nr:hypothetical protein [Ahrensia sp.]